MAKSGKKKSLRFSTFRRRPQAANDRRFCIIWINKMVKKKVERQIAELRSEFLLMHHALREEMAADLQEQLRELAVEEVRDRALHYTRLEQQQRITSRWRRKMEKEYSEKTEEDDDDANSLDLRALSFNFPEKASDTDSIFIMRKHPKYELGESMRILLDDSSDDDNSDSDNSDVSNDADTSSQPAECEQKENQQISSDVDTAAGTSQLMKESEESSRNPCHANPSLMPEELGCEGENVQVGRGKAVEALFMVGERKEWLDKQEMTGNHNKAMPAGPQNTEKQGAAALPASQKQIKQNVKEVDTMTKIKTYFSDLFNPHTAYKWERFEDED